MTNPYLDLTAAFNQGRRRALVSSGQAVVLHRLAIMSKDGDTSYNYGGSNVLSYHKISGDFMCTSYIELTMCYQAGDAGRARSRAGSRAVA